VARYPQAQCRKGSQRWIQEIINGDSSILDDAIRLGRIDWRSPLAADAYSEYRDDAFLERLSITLPKRSLPSFWPRGGPQWDALGRAATGEVVLVEAKAHLNELYSPQMGATAEPSVARIQLSLRETAAHLSVPDGFDWSRQFYQYANRLAHAYFLSAVNAVPAKLVFVYFIGDADMNGPNSREEWATAIHVVHHSLGLATIPPYVLDVFIDVRARANPL
jgi:hypothetical protein